MNPFNRLPPVVVGLVAAALAVEAVLQLGALGLVGGPGAVGWRMAAMTGLGFSDPLFEHMRIIGAPTLGGARRFLSFPPVHLGAGHAVFGAVLLLALGKTVAERFSTAALLALLTASAAGGALSYGLLQDSAVLLTGATRRSTV